MFFTLFILNCACNTFPVILVLSKLYLENPQLKNFTTLFRWTCSSWKNETKSYLWQKICDQRCFYIKNIFKLYTKHTSVKAKCFIKENYNNENSGNISSSSEFLWCICWYCEASWTAFNNLKN